MEVPGIELDKVSPNVRLNLYWHGAGPYSDAQLQPRPNRFDEIPSVRLDGSGCRQGSRPERNLDGWSSRPRKQLPGGRRREQRQHRDSAAIFIPPEAVREFQVQIATYSAEFGHSMGAQINVTTKSGSNAFHGELWDFSRTSALEPLSLQNQKANLTKTPRLSAHQFGADLGGPIVQGKTFFFGIFQGNLQRQAALASEWSHDSDAGGL